jgi:hypothetical protein
MSSGQANNSHMYGALTGNPVSVTPGGNVATTVIYNNIVNVGRVVLRSSNVYQLPDCNAAWVKIHASPTNVNNVWLGGIIEHVPEPNVGYPIVPGATLEIPCTNSNQFSLIPTQDGDTVYILIGAVDNKAAITPGSPPVLDVTPPTITSQSPANGVSGQPINTAISLLANKNLDPSTVNNSTVSISPVPPGITINVTPDSGNAANILVLYSGGNLAPSTIYTLGVSGIANINGYVISPPYSGTFTTGTSTTPPSTTPPTIVSTNPASGATNVPLSVNPTITFSLPILASSITTTSIRVTDVAVPSFLTGYTFSQSGDLKTVTINGLSLANSKQYRIDVYNTPSPAGAGIENTVGIFLDNTYSITFTTVAPSVLLYNVSGSGGSYNSLNITNFYQMVGIYANGASSQLIGKVPVACTLVLKKVGNPPGTVVVQLDQLVTSGGVDNQNLIFSIGTITANTLGTSDTTISFSFPSNTHAFAFRTSLSVYYQHGDSSNYVMAKVTTVDAFDGSNTCILRYLYDGTVGSVLAGDLAGTISVKP